MVSRNNQRIKIERMLNQKQRFGIRKLSIGVVSVLLGTMFFLGNGVVHADTVSNSQITTTSSTPASSSDSNSSNVTITSSETGSAASSSTSWASTTTASVP
ncbi:YSIRK-type signal peptide-containing protein [Limosilactobacillus fermentum]|uniref:YSIRK-type signal peptide-containing protein n=2 Tax=Limosilactobacillus fermentum TaxID=1613 RepID=UPI0032201C8C